MQADERADAAALFDLVLLHLVRAAAADVLGQVVAVGTGEAAEEPAGQPGVAAELPGPLPGDLEVDQVRPGIVADDDVLALLEVDVGDAAGVQRIEQAASGVGKKSSLTISWR